VVGVILNLSVWFALHVLFTKVESLEYGPISLAIPAQNSLDPLALGLVALAAVVTVLTRRSMVLTLLLMAMAGVCSTLLPVAG